jgi:hypothetical protein
MNHRILDRITQQCHNSSSGTLDLWQAGQIKTANVTIEFQVWFIFCLLIPLAAWRLE